MKPKSSKSLELYDIMIKRGYPAEFCDQITKNLNTDWTAGRMIGYLSHYKKLPLEEIADEMLAILSDRNRIMQKHEMEEINARWNEYLNGERIRGNTWTDINHLLQLQTVYYLMWHLYLKKSGVLL